LTKQLPSKCLEDFRKGHGAALNKDAFDGPSAEPATTAPCLNLRAMKFLLAFQQNNVNRTYRGGVVSRINLMISAASGERPASFFEKICSPLRRTLNEPGAPARRRIGIPSSRSISFLRLTASALISAQKKQRLISTAITVHLNSESDSVKQASRHLEAAQV
jgi:hypothetical protein